MSWTERRVLDALHQRLCVKDERAGALRYAVGEKVGLDPTYPSRVLDLIAVDTWRSSGYALHGYEVKVSRSDLRRELSDLSKSQAFTQHLDTFTIVAPEDVLKGWRDLPIPAEWGVMSVSEGGVARNLRRASGAPGYGGAQRPMDRALTAALARSISLTAARRCAVHGELNRRQRALQEFLRGTQPPVVRRPV